MKNKDWAEVSSDHNGYLRCMLLVGLFLPKRRLGDLKALTVILEVYWVSAYSLAQVLPFLLLYDIKVAKPAYMHTCD